MLPDCFYHYFSFAHVEPTYIRWFAILPGSGLDADEKKIVFKIFCLIKKEMQSRIDVLYEKKENHDFEFKYRVEDEDSIMRIIENYFSKSMA
ncbi:MAG: hypothetical protein K940chlam8_00862 [Chlamydiae bacterium]|nr:hypothetical protein [Chlamydiota bacterium]